jgi:hypothetical protein
MAPPGAGTPDGTTDSISARFRLFLCDALDRPPVPLLPPLPPPFVTGIFLFLAPAADVAAGTPDGTADSISARFRLRAGTGTPGTSAAATATATLFFLLAFLLLLPFLLFAMMLLAVS